MSLFHEATCLSRTTKELRLNVFTNRLHVAVARLRCPTCRSRSRPRGPPAPWWPLHRSLSAPAPLDAAPPLPRPGTSLKERTGNLLCDLLLHLRPHGSLEVATAVHVGDKAFSPPRVVFPHIQSPEHLSKSTQRGRFLRCFGALVVLGPGA